MHGLQEEWVASLPKLDLKVFVTPLTTPFPVPNPQSGPEWSNDVDATLIEAWSGGIPRDEVCARVNNVANAALKAAKRLQSSSRGEGGEREHGLPASVLAPGRHLEASARLDASEAGVNAKRPQRKC